MKYVPTPPLGERPEDDIPCASGSRGDECTEQQLQCVALPVLQPDDGGVDPLLRSWKKFSGNPVVSEAPPHGTTRQFRDPSSTWQLSNGDTVTVVGGMVDEKGTAILYRLDETLTKWEHLGSLFQLDPRSEAAGVDFECPDVMLIPGTDNELSLLKWGLGPSRTDFGTYLAPLIIMIIRSDCIVIADHRVALAALVGTISSASPPRFRTPRLDGNGEDDDDDDEYSDVAIASPRREGSGMFKLDYGTFYASKTFNFQSDGGSSGRRRERRVIWAWSDETDVCRPWPACEREWPKPPKDLRRRWRGLQTLPRDIQWDSRAGVVLTRPVPELARLRLPRYQDEPARAEMKLQSDARRVEEDISGLAANSAEFRATFDVSSIVSAGASACGYRFGIRLYHTDGSSSSGSDTTHTSTRDYTDVVYQLEVQSTSPVLGLWVMRNHTGGATSDHGDNQPQGGSVIISPAGIEVTTSEWRQLSLTVFSDLSILEAFAQDGQEAVTSRIYPVTKLLKGTDALAPWSAALIAETKPLRSGGCGAPATRAGAKVLVSGAVEAYELGSCWVDTPDLLPI